MTASRLHMRAAATLGLLCAGAWLLAATPGLARTLTNGRITLDQADGSAGLSTTNQDRVDAISWIDSSGTSTGNLAANGGPTQCGDPLEFFGQSYDEGDGAGLYMVIAGTVSKWFPKPVGAAGTSVTNGRNTCAGAQFSGVTKTTYTLSTSAQRINALRITRAFVFNAHVAAEAYNLRAYVARLPLAHYATVLVPSATGAIQTFNANACGTACEITTWNGKWFADDDGSGHGMAVIRDVSSTWPAVIAMDNDSFSASNLTSVLLLRPSAGWSGTVTETDYLCFYDPISWPAANRAAGKLPKGCNVPTP